MKWWLLAVPRLAIVAILSGGGWWLGTAQTWGPESNSGWLSGFSLLGLLVLIAGAILLFTKR